MPSKAPSQPYAAYIRSPAWYARRSERFALDGHRCALCGAAEDLQVHHLTYKRLGHERMSDLRTVCGACHAGLHEGFDWRKSGWTGYTIQPPVSNKSRKKKSRAGKRWRGAFACQWCGGRWPKEKHERLCVGAGVHR